jgi:hypothetical protein
LEENSDGTKDQILTMEFGSSLITSFSSEKYNFFIREVLTCSKEKLSQGKESEMKLNNKSVPHSNSAVMV